MAIDIVILAAGDGKRMCGKFSKVLYKIGNLPILNHILNTISQINYSNAFIVIDKSTKINKLSKNCKLIYQDNKLGTAYATKLTIDHLKEDIVLILYGDTPFISINTLNVMLDKIRNGFGDMVLFAFKLQNSDDQYGRLLINSNNNVEKVLEYQDIKGLNYNFDYANSGIMAIKTELLRENIDKINNLNAQKEYYLTDIVEIVRKNGANVCYIEGLYEEAMGINTPQDLINAENYFQQRMRNNFINSGIILHDPKTSFFSHDTNINDVGCAIHHNVVFGEGVTINGEVEIMPFCYLEQCIINAKSKIGPFAHIRGNTFIDNNVTIGNFVEIKESIVGDGSKIKHHSYIGNTIIGSNTNIGAGTITCNYDGRNKHHTNIGKNCFVGANTIFVAPVNMMNNSKTAAGSVITEDIEEYSLSISRAPQINKTLKSDANG